MEVPRLKKRPRRLCEHCDTELCHTQYFDHRKRYFKNGVWEKKNKRARSDEVQSLHLSSHDPTGGSFVPSMCKDLEDNLQTHINRPLSVSPQTGEKKLLSAISGLSRQLTQFAADVNQQFTLVNSRLLSIEDRLAALESKKCVEETNSKKRRRVHNPKIAEAVRCLHNSETNSMRYESEQRVTSPHNETVSKWIKFRES
ncbi:hypothetical protein PO909_027875 [Leuciscus waleckii]